MRFECNGAKGFWVLTYRRRALRAAPRVPLGRGHAASIPGASGRWHAPGLRAALAILMPAVVVGLAC